MKRNMKTRCLALLTVFLLVPASTRAQAEAKPVKVPFELLRSNHMAIQVKINGKGPYRLIFDTGAPMTLLSNKVAKEAGVLPKDARPPIFTVFGSVGQFPIQSLEVEGLKVEKLNAIVMDHPAVVALAQAIGPLEGIVGFPFFARFKMTIDYQAKEMTFVPNGYEPGDILETLTATLLTRKPPPPLVVAPAGQWGVVVDKEANDEGPGVAVKEVRAGSAAAAAGIKPGDRIVSIDGRWTDTVLECYQAAGLVKPGAAVPVVIQRDGKETRLAVKPRLGL